MTSETRPMNLSDEQKFDLLEHPEQWPDDPELQAELAELLELHLGLEAHADDLDAALQKSLHRPWYRQPWLGAAAAVFLALVPSVYAYNRAQHEKAQRLDVDRYNADAVKRQQVRLWDTYLSQYASLLRDFEKNPPLCGEDRNHQDRTTERNFALDLREISRQLYADNPTGAHADIIRGLHDWLQELTLEDGCMTPERVQQLRSLAKNQNLSEEVERLRKLLARSSS